MSLGDNAAAWLAQPHAKIFATGIPEIDSRTNGGLRAGDISVIGAATGMGKSAFVEQMALEIALKHEVLFLPLEMGERDTTERMGAKIERVSLQSLRDEGLSDYGLEALNRRKMLVHQPTDPVDVNELMRLIVDGDCPVVVVDHAREILGWLSDGKSTHVAPAIIMRYLRRCARETNKHIILIAQLNRTGYRDRPTSAALQDTSALEQNAALVLLLHRPFAGKGATDCVMEIIVAKNRYGPTGLSHMRWSGPTMKVFPMSEEEEAAVTCCDRIAK